MIEWRSDPNEYGDAVFIEDAMIGATVHGFVAQLPDGTWIGKPGDTPQRFFDNQEDARLWVSSLIMLEL